MFYGATEKDMHTQQILHQRCLYLVLIYTLCVFVYFQHSVYLAIEEDKLKFFEKAIGSLTSIHFIREINFS